VNPYTKPLPSMLPWSKKFWEYAKEHKLVAQKCEDCGKLIFHPRKFCPECWSGNLGWQELSGKAKLASFSVTLAGVEPVFAVDLPYVLALVDLKEGLRMMSNIVDCKTEELRIGMDLVVTFRDCTEDISLPLFRPDNK
jgi:uncharacterized protein